MDGNAIVYCQGQFSSTGGKTAHGLVRFTRRYEVVAVIDASLEGRDAAEVLDGTPKGIPLVSDLPSGLEQARAKGTQATHFVIGLAPEGGRLPPEGRAAVLEAIDAKLNIDSGMHDFLSEDPEIAGRAAEKGVTIRDVRKPPPRHLLHFFSGKIREVSSLKLALLGTDSAVGKRTTSWLLVQALERAGKKAELVGTGQTAWMQGARYGCRLDSLINDFVTGEIEHAVWLAWQEQRPDVIVIEGQGSLMHPAYTGGFEILSAAKPDGIIVQHAPARAEYDGFPGSPMHALDVQIRALELISGKPVVAVTLNHEKLTPEQVEAAVKEIGASTGLPVCAPLLHGTDSLANAILQRFKR